LIAENLYTYQHRRQQDAGLILFFCFKTRSIICIATIFWWNNFYWQTLQNRELPGFVMK